MQRTQELTPQLITVPTRFHTHHAETPHRQPEAATLKFMVNLPDVGQYRVLPQLTFATLTNAPATTPSFKFRLIPSGSRVLQQVDLSVSRLSSVEVPLSIARQLLYFAE